MTSQLVYRGPDGTRTIPLNGDITVGRSGACQLPVADPYVSEVHCQVTFVDGHCGVELTSFVEAGSPSAPPGPASFWTMSGWPALLVLVGIAIGAAGFFHFVRSSGGIRVCAKESWGLGNTFVDADDFTGVPIIGLLDRASTVRALVKCEVLELPASWKRSRRETSP